VKLFEIGFLTIRLADVFDILLAALLIYALFRIIKGSIALNIFVGFVLVYIFWLVVKAMQMRLLASILGQFIGVGVIALLIVFQQEIRRFLLMVGQNRVSFAAGAGWRQVLPWNWKANQAEDINFEELARACKQLSKTYTGALIILARSSELKFFTSTGIPIDGEMSAKLLESIFSKKSPMHDGAVIMVKNKIKAASCILPVSESQNLPPEFGLRHRSALGIVEQTDAMAIIVSEETGRISIGSKGTISNDLSKDENLPKRFFQEYYEVADHLETIE
jgi:uncharacterized protein (TIGR00159 family)